MSINSMELPFDFNADDTFLAEIEQFLAEYAPAPAPASMITMTPPLEANNPAENTVAFNLDDITDKELNLFFDEQNWASPFSNSQCMTVSPIAESDLKPKQKSNNRLNSRSSASSSSSFTQEQILKQELTDQSKKCGSGSHKLRHSGYAQAIVNNSVKLSVK